MNNDPRQIKTKYISKCCKCGQQIPKGVNVYYWPIGKSIAHLTCGHDDFKTFIESVQDENFYG